MKDTTKLMSEIEALTTEQLKTISQKILQMLGSVDGVSFSTSETITQCRKCGDSNIVKYGKDKNGNQRYKCRYCGATFISSSFSLVSHTHHKLFTWEKYIQLLLSKTSLVKCAEECGISVRTAFLWRHKILNALQKDQDNRVLSGIVEIDETYFHISYKGNHKNSCCFVMPRKPHKRGGDTRSQVGSRACVMCAIERNGQTYGEVLGKGQPTIPKLTHAFESRLLPESILLADKSIAIRNYFKRHPSIELVQLESHTIRKRKWGPPEVRGAFHIQNINNMHARFRKFLTSYNGVSTKYLNHYLNLFVWIENHKKSIDFNPCVAMSSFLTQTNTYAPIKTILSMPPIPQIA